MPYSGRQIAAWSFVGWSKLLRPAWSLFRRSLLAPVAFAAPVTKMAAWVAAARPHVPLEEEQLAAACLEEAPERLDVACDLRGRGVVI